MSPDDRVWMLCLKSFELSFDCCASPVQVSPTYARAHSRSGAVCIPSTMCKVPTERPLGRVDLHSLRYGARSPTQCEVLMFGEAFDVSN
jgi:hypothetical protein